jgi:hypothetical protein
VSPAPDPLLLGWGYHRTGNVLQKAKKGKSMATFGTVNVLPNQSKERLDEIEK